MEEKVIIRSEQYDIGKKVKRFFRIAIGLIIIGIVIHLLEEYTAAQHYAELYSNRGWSYDYYFLLAKMLFQLNHCISPWFTWLGTFTIFATVFINWWLGSYTLTVTNKRIYGKTSFGKRVDLPVDSVSAVSTGIFKGIAVATSSGKIVFGLIKNRDEIHAEITKLIVSRQQAGNPASSSTTDELKKFKELLDAGIITQEEFNAKKKQLLEI